MEAVITYLTEALSRKLHFGVWLDNRETLQNIIVLLKVVSLFTKIRVPIRHGNGVFKRNDIEKCRWIPNCKRNSTLISRIKIWRSTWISDPQIELWCTYKLSRAIALTVDIDVSNCDVVITSKVRSRRKRSDLVKTIISHSLEIGRRLTSSGLYSPTSRGISASRSLQCYQLVR